MALDDARVFAMMASCFAPVSEKEWERIAAPAEWSEFLAAVRELVQGARLPGGERTLSVRARMSDPLQEYLSEAEVRALFAPPSFAEKSSFEAHHFTGGLPDSALPIESLYRTWTHDPARGAFAGQTGLYMSDTALYMRDLLESLGLSAPASFSACPDHLSLELEVLSYLLDEGDASDARAFLVERFSWLTAYRLRLVELGEEALFFLALVDVLVGICASVVEIGKKEEEDEEGKGSR